MNFLGLPLYEAVLLDDEDRMTVVSLVDDPAVESDFITFSEDKRPQLFSVQDEEQQVILGVAIRADYPIYRIDSATGYEYYITFSKEVIKDIVKRYSKDGYFNNVSLQHNGQLIDGVTMIEMFIKDSAKGINPQGFENITDGSLFIAYHVEDRELWNEIKNSGEINGFSIEIYTSLIPAGNFEKEETLDSLVEEALGDKKKEFSVSTDLTKAMENKQVVDITVDRNTTLENAQIYQIGKQNKTNVAVIYAKKAGYDTNQWYVLELKRLSNVRPSTAAFVEWNVARQGASWEGVQDLLDTEDITSIKSAVVPRNDYERAITERKICMITYRDASEEDCTFSRQCFVGEYGFNRKGNAALRAYQYYGSTHSESEGWKMFLMSRILSFQILDYMEPVSVPPVGFNPTGPDRDGFDCQLRAQFD